MNCEKYRKLLPDYIRGDLTEETLNEFENHLNTCAVCADETSDMEELWHELHNIPQAEPSPDAIRRFSGVLTACVDSMREIPRQVSACQPQNTINHTVYHWHPFIQVAAAVVILALGIWSGRLVESRKHMKQEIVSLHTEVAEMRKMLSVSLLNQASASQRLQGVSMSGEVDEPDDIMIRALVKTMNTDPNVNIRLASIDALERYTDRQWVKTELVESLKHQQSPLVQVSLINLVVELDEKEAVTVLESLIEDEYSLEPVKKRARTGLDKLI